ncbi:cmgc dyrk dyrk2 protein kinase [Plasmopara halstedii]|uniref:dual-specificity kinase n=1 Tax=Plasmopara halstedii TaxID=4781 RepID=A0A0N7L516_PLAHL|nr:cmgc dyrk dyrk2 protein kinase [Plasmopara halstedii]CEG40219.1 cmgc dyrk dyrk2 protein kinase [Plasmopara halstedii]|eukprot:XP_024576588.1 cmgc dyrk dyrk2 protein kinase [Plasmopara halstedii]
MEPVAASSHSMELRRAQRLLPALAPAPPSSGLASDKPCKIEQLQTQEPTTKTKASVTKKPLIAHIFFNRRPLDFIQRTTSSLLATSKTTTSTSVVATSVAAEERKFWQPHRPRGEKSGRRRLQQLQVTQQLNLNARAESDAEEAAAKLTAARRSSGLCSGEQVLMNAQKAAELTAFEQVEILKYKDIYFISKLANKRDRRNGKAEKTLPDSVDENLDDRLTKLYNHGYDDEHGDYLVVIGDHLAYRYEVLSALGQGSFGQVVCCLDHRTRTLVAVKVICNRKTYHTQAFKEVRLLTQLQKAIAGDDKDAHVICMDNYFEFRNHLCIVFKVLGLNLYDYLKMRQFRGLPMNSVRTIATQLVQALNLLKREQILHSDLKPENILLDAGTVAADGVVNKVTLIDFGSSCLESGPMSKYIQTRFYRSPEVLLGLPYSYAIDMWSLACILVELHTGYPIYAGENEQDQLACIMEVLDVPPPVMVRNSKRRLILFDEVINPAVMDCVDYVPKTYVNSRGQQRTPGSRSFMDAVKSNDVNFVAFLTKCFVWDPCERLTPEQALQEPWLRDQVNE